MIKPQGDPCKIRLGDLIASGHGETVVNILIDLNSFWSHENRESLAGGEPSTANPSPPPPQQARLGLVSDPSDDAQPGRMTPVPPSDDPGDANDESDESSNSTTSSPR